MKEIENYCHKIISNYVKQNDLLIDNVAYIQSEAKAVLKKKFLFICLTLFFNKRDAFFDLLRADIETDIETLDFWDELNEIYDQLKYFDVVDRTIAKTFLHKLFENEKVASEVLQYVKFRFQNDMDLVNYKVDFQLDTFEEYNNN